jgi:hypothetical protein
VGSCDYEQIDLSPVQTLSATVRHPDLSMTREYPSADNDLSAG